jgi:PBP1b-binding outer membrane lipoprotein LpoB
MKILIVLITALFLVSCATTKTPQKEVNEKVEKMMSSAWYQRVMRR